MAWQQSTGHKGFVLRPTHIGTDRARTQLLFYTLTFSVTPHPSTRTPCTVHKDSIKYVHWSLHPTLRRRSVCSRTGNSTIVVVHANRNRPLPRPFWQPVCSTPSPGARMSEVPSRDPPTCLSVHRWHVLSTHTNGSSEEV